MSDPVAVLSSCNISRSELEKFICNVGGFVDDPGYFIGTVQTLSAAIWISFGHEDLPDFIADDCKEMTEKLGGLPSFLVYIETSTNRESRRLALQFVVEMSKTWPIICSDGRGGFLSGNEINSNREDDPDLAVRGKQHEQN